MDRNQTIGLVLMSMLVLIYFQFFAPKPEIPLEENPPIEQSISTEASPALSPVITAIDSAARQEKLAQMGTLATAAEGEEKEVVLENQLVQFTFSTKGGMVKKVVLKDFQTYTKEPLVLIDELNNTQSLTLPLANPIAINDLYFTASASETRVENDTLTLRFSVATETGTLVQEYTLAPNSYELGYKLITSQSGQNFTSNSALFAWSENMKKLENDLQDSRNKSSVNYYTNTGNFETVGANGIDLTEESPEESVRWIALKQKFFTAALISKDNFKVNFIRTEGKESDTTYVKNTSFESVVSLEDLEKGNLSFYYGPNNYKILKKVTEGFSENIDLGWALFSWINKFVIIQVFQFLEKYISNYGIIIILLVLFIKLILSPLSYSSYLSMAKMKILKPELDELKEKYGDDMQKIQSEQMQLYSKAGVNPLSGCIPLLLQMPILLAMFNFFPNSIELRQEAFLWADDLSTYDNILNLPFSIPFYGSHVSLFTILMTASTILYTWSNNQVSTVTGPMKQLSYIMPVMFMFVLNSFPASLSFYYFVSNMVTFGQQYIIRQFVDEEKLKKIMEENKKKNQNKTKSSFQQRIEEAMKASKEAKGKK
ncbi:membrane protein insertase YidC [Cytophagales bacterium LB-30]|uniref:Membrane protein insertase YidC n=1 Tax=Shiella aurantiaca TaxID=3058365 RepID=A0ABT8F4C9_9BACT|nr:membrane protein insertase YidC [Shiella aurantiaca]MDN4165260.1 membrane protein insertase YidC [Shiella aurantiaca]